MTIMNKYFLTAVSAALLSAGAVSAAEVTVNPPAGNIPAAGGAPTGAYGASRVEAKLNIDIKDGIKNVHFIRDNSDPFVVTKAYEVKNANPFVLAGVLKSIVSGSLVNSPVTVESVMYRDGVGVLLISAEEYRFKDIGNGMSMDALVAAFDKKDLPNVSGTVDMAYFPKYNPASVLLRMLEESGIGFTSGAATDKKRTIDGTTITSNGETLTYAVTDDNMNVLVMTASGFDMTDAMNFLKEADTPTGEIHLNYKLIEVYAENDQKLGLDFQAWKNNDGIDLFSAGGKYGTNWNGGLTPNNGYRFSEFYNFNPKWNTKYLDFLTVSGKAKVVSSGSLLVANGGIANLTVTDGLFSIVNKDIKKEVVTDAATVTTTTTGVTERVSITKAVEAAVEYLPWTLSDVLPSDSADRYYASRLKEIPAEALDHNIREGKTQDVEPVDGNLFQLSVAGGVHGKSSNLAIALASTSVIGWDGQGKARLTRSFYNTQIQISNEKKEFVIGGLSKSSVVRSVSGVPLLKDLPVIGWIFSTETDTVKKSQFVLIATAELVTPKSALANEVKADLGNVKTKVEKAVECPAGTLGFQQLLIDTDEIK